jgi:hypothetical protein
MEWVSRRGEGKRNIVGGENGRRLHIYIGRQHNETHQTLFEKGGIEI